MGGKPKSKNTSKLKSSKSKEIIRNNGKKVNGIKEVNSVNQFKLIMFIVIII